MQSMEVPRENWPEFLDEFSRRNLGKPITIELLSPDVGDQVEAERLPLMGITADNKDTLGPMIEVIAGDTPDANVSRIVHRPTRVRVATDDQGVEQAMEIESVSEPTVLLRFGEGPRPQNYVI